MASLPLPPAGPSPFLPPPPPLPAEETQPLIRPVAVADEFSDEPTGEHVSIAVLVAELHQAVSRAESYAHAAEAQLLESSLQSPAGPSRRARRIVDQLTSARESNIRALELVEALAAELAKPR
jgi:hypothetical protein